MMLRLHVPIFRWTGHTELSWKKSQRDGVLEKHNTKISLWEFWKIVKIMFFSIGMVSTLLAIWSIWIKIKPNKKAKQYKIGANWMEIQQSMSYNL
jgi:hypothetical protein